MAWGSINEEGCRRILRTLCLRAAVYLKNCVVLNATFMNLKETWIWLVGRVKGFQGIKWKCKKKSCVMGGEQSTCTIVVYLIILFAAARDFSSTVYELLIFIFFFSFLHLSYGIFLSSCFFFCSHLLLFYLFLKIFFPFVTFYFFFFPGLEPTKCWIKNSRKKLFFFTFFQGWGEWP